MAAAYGQITGLDTLQAGLCSLRKSKMMTAPEFKNMFWAMERHHSDLKLAHLTGKAQDLQNHAQRDTKFYNILVKMLCELGGKRIDEQKSGLQKVYIWYMANKHALYCGPHFGRQIMKDKAQKVLRKATTPGRAKPAKGQTTQSYARPSSGGSILYNTARSETGKGGIVSNAELGHEIQRDCLPGWESYNLPSPANEAENDTVLKSPPDEENRAQSAMATPSVLIRPKTSSSVTFAPFKEQSINCPERVMSLKQGSVHSIASLVNPHTVLANELAPKDAEDDEYLPPAMKIHLDNLSTANAKAQSLSQPDRPKPRPKSGIPRAVLIKENEENAFVQQTLEEFYKTADFIKPSPRLVYSPRRVRAPLKPRAKSAPIRRYSNTVRVPTSLGVSQKPDAPKVESQPSQDNVPKPADDTPKPKAHVVPNTGVKLDTIIHVIDSVSGDMTALTDDLLPEAQTGIRQPSASVKVTESVIMEGEDSAVLDVSTIISRDGAMQPPENTPRPYSPHKETPTFDDSRRPSTRCSSATAVIDWRGRVQPDTMRYKWSKTAFGGHTYLKKWPQRNLRSAGSTSAGKRPKTAPITAKEKWKTQKTTNRKAIGAATHNTVIVNQEDVDTMITVQHLLGEGDRTGSYGSLDSLDEEFWRQFHKDSHPVHSATPTMEFLSFITPSLTAGVEQRGHHDDSKAEELQEDIEDEDIDETSPRDVFDESEEPQKSKICIDLPTFNEEALEAAVDEELQELPKDTTTDTELPNTPAFVDQDAEENLPQTPKETTPKNIVESHVEVSGISPVAGSNPSPITQRSLPLQDLTTSDQWQFSLAEELQRHSKKGNHFCDVQLGPENEENMTTRVERSAGRMPSQTHSTSVQMLAFSRRYSEALRRAPPLRTPPSIPTPQSSAKKPNRKGRIFVELEHQARKSRSPRNFLRRVQSYRSMDSARSETAYSALSNDTVVGTSLQVCRLPTSSRGQSSMMSTDYDYDSLYQKNWDQTPFLSREPTSLQAINENAGRMSFDRQVTLTSNSRGVILKPMTAPMPTGMQTTHLGSLDGDLKLPRNATFTSIGSKPTGTSGAMALGLPPPSRSIAHIGRPIAQHSHVPDPDELIQAVQVQKEAAAAVDIQRIFRGYVARNIYKSLVSDERQRVEDERKAAIRIQSTYRGHLTRKSAIYNRPPLDPELVSWGKDVSKIQATNASRRNAKMENLSNEMSSNQREANTKMAFIGPHVEIYDIYHPKKTGPSKKELNQAATKLQKVVRGWVIRRRMEKLARKATWYGSSFPKMVKEYKTMIKRVQHQHGVDKAKTPFSIKDMSDYIDTRRRYESVFEKKSFGGELERNDIEAFFKECDLYPSQAEIEEAMDVTMHGKASRRQGKGLKKNELLDMIFYIYVPPATELEGTRQSTWMNPIIDGKEARKLIGSEFVEPAPLEPCAKLVISMKKEQARKEQAKKEEEERKHFLEKRMSLASLSSTSASDGKKSSK